MNVLLSLLAQTTTTAPTTQGEQPGFTLRTLIPMLLMVAVLYFFVFRAKRNQDKAKAQMMDKLKPGQRIQTIGGIIGVLTQVGEKEVTVKVDETNNVKIKFSRNAIHRVMDEEKTETK